MRKKTGAVSQAYLNLVRTDLAAYNLYSHRGFWKPARHLEYACRQVQNFVERPAAGAFDILIISMPPQHGKSMTITETLPAFYHGRHPDNRIIMASYNDETAERFTRRNKEKIKLFGAPLFGVRIGNVDRATEYEIEGHQGRLISCGIMGGITGNPANLFIVDDPIKNRQEADSEITRDRIWGEWLYSIRTRLAAGAKVIVIMTRWHEDDLAGRLLKYEKHVQLLNLPCEAEDNDPLGRRPGEALAPEIGKGDAWLKDFKAGYQGKEGSRAWLALFQGHPTSEQGNLLKREWWKFYDRPPEPVQIILSVDAAFKDGDSNDFVSIQAWGKRAADMYLLDNNTAHRDFPNTLKAIREMYRHMKHVYHRRPAMILIEDKANGSAIISILRREIPGVVPVTPDGGKVARVNAVSPAIEAGNVWLPKEAPWLDHFLEECAPFPLGAHDDQVDAMSQALDRFIYFGAAVPDTPQTWPFPEMERLYRRRDDPLGEALYTGDADENYFTGGY